MKVWDEEDVVKQLAVARKKVPSISSEEDSSSSNNNKPPPEVENSIAFLLIIVRKFAQKHYEFLYLPANCYERVEQAYNKTAIVMKRDSEENDDNNNDMDSSSGVWIGRSAEHDDNNNDGSFHILSSSAAFETHYVGKAIFHTQSGEPLMKLEGSCGWKEALKQKYHNLDAQNRVDKDNAAKNQEVKNHTTAKAVAAAALGGGAGTTIAAGMAANSVAAGATVVAAEAVGGGSVAVGGFAATAQTVGTGAVMATPVGMVAAAGALGGLGLYYVMHRRNQAKKMKEEQEQVAKEKAIVDNKAKEDEATVVTDYEDSSSDGEIPSGYQPLSEDQETEEMNCNNIDSWVSVVAKQVESEDNFHCVFVPSVCSSREDAEYEWPQLASNTIAKALFSPEGKVVHVENADPGDRDGWSKALALHYDFLVDHNMLNAITNGEDAKEDTPLLQEDEAPQPNKQTCTGTNSNKDNWLVDTIRRKRQDFTKSGGPSALFSLRPKYSV